MNYITRADKKQPLYVPAFRSIGSDGLAWQGLCGGSGGVQVGQGLLDVRVDADGLRFDLPGAGGFAGVDAGVGRRRVAGGHALEGVFDDGRGVVAHAQLQEQDPPAPTGPQKCLVPLRRLAPARVLHKFVVGAQIHGQGLAAVGADGQQFGGDPPLPLARHHLPDRALVVESFLATRPGTLEQAVVPLGVKEPGLVKARLLEAVVHVGGDDKIVLLPDQRQQIVVDRPGRVQVAVDEDVAAPIGPKFLRRGEGVKAAGVHIGKAVCRGKIGEVPPEPRPGIGEPRRRGQPRARADYNGVRFVQRLPEPLYVIRVIPGRFRSRHP